MIKCREVQRFSIFLHGDTDPLPEAFLQILVVNVPNTLPSTTARLIRLGVIYKSQ